MRRFLVFLVVAGVAVGAASWQEHRQPHNQTARDYVGTVVLVDVDPSLWAFNQHGQTVLLKPEHHCVWIESVAGTAERFPASTVIYPTDSLSHELHVGDRVVCRLLADGHVEIIEVIATQVTYLTEESHAYQ